MAKQQQIKKVKEDFYLPHFRLNEFLDEINTLTNHFEHKKAKFLLQLAALKIKNTGEESGNDETTTKEMLEYIYNVIEGINFEIDFYDLNNIDFNNDIEPEEMFQFRIDEVRNFLNSWKVNYFYSIEKRLIREGYFDYKGTWVKNKRVLVYIINKLVSEGFFKRRKETGEWLTLLDYVNFFKWRYYINLEQFVDFDELIKIEDNSYLPWLTEYLKV